MIPARNAPRPAPWNGQEVARIYAAVEMHRVYLDVVDPVTLRVVKGAVFDCCGLCGDTFPALGSMGATSWRQALEHATDHLS